MEKRNIVIIVVVILLIAGVCGYFLLNSPELDSTKQRAIPLTKSAVIKVPKDENATHNASKKGVFFYSGDDLNITVCSNISKASGIKELNQIKDSIETGSKKIVDNNVVMYLKDGVYSIFIKNTQYNDTVLLQSTSKSLLFECWKNLKFHDPSEKFKFNDATDKTSSGTDVIDAIAETEKAVGASSSSSDSGSSVSSDSSSDYTSSSSESYSSSSSSDGSSGSDYVAYADYSSDSGSSGGESSSDGSLGGGSSDGSSSGPDYADY